MKTCVLFIVSRLSQMKHRLDAKLCRFYFSRVTLHVSGASAHHQEYLKLVQRPLVHVLSLQVSHHISLLGPEMPALIRRCDDNVSNLTCKICGENVTNYKSGNTYIT